MSDWQAKLVEDEEEIARILRDARRIAVLGIKTEAQAGEPAHYVPRYLHDAGYEVVPVPVYYPDATEILGRKVYRRVAEVPGEVDVVNVFRRSGDVPPHVDDILAARPGTVWMQSGIRNEGAARRLAEAGIRVVQDRCIMVDHRRLVR